LRIGTVLAVAVSGMFLVGDSGWAGTSQTLTHQPAMVLPAAGVRTPPAPICGSRGLLGPQSPPPGARVVRASQNLPRIAGSSRRGKVLWLAPGVHRLGHDQYDQVQPRDHQVFIGAPGAIIDGRHVSLYAFGGHASGVVISHLTIRHFGSSGDNNDQGVVNHDAAPHWHIRHNTIERVAGAGVFMGNHNRVVSNCLTHNGQYGFSSYRRNGVHDLTLRHNEISFNNTDDWENRRPGCGCTGGGKFWDSRDARVLDNWVHDNHGPGLWADTNNTGFLFARNLVSDNEREGLFYEISYNARIVHNTFARNAWLKGQENDDFTGAIYLSESGSDRRAGAVYRHHLVIAHNRFVNNWNGVMAWENSDRFAGSPANSSSDFTTLVNPEVATVDACATPSKITSEPYFDDCRWKVQNLRIKHNRFVFERSKIPGCTKKSICGYQGLFSNYGTYPDWSPYQAYVVPNHITFHQDNTWSDNTYTGPWRFMAHTLGNSVSWHRWRSAKYGQDTGSIRR
jgi:hypothetical protein